MMTSTTLTSRLTLVVILQAIVLATFVQGDDFDLDQCLETTLRTAEQACRLTKGTPKYAECRMSMLGQRLNHCCVNCKTGGCERCIQDKHGNWYLSPARGRFRDFGADRLQ